MKTGHSSIAKGEQSPVIEAQKSAGQIAYEADVKKYPVYHDGKPRRGWDNLPQVIQWHWNRPHMCKSLTNRA